MPLAVIAKRLNRAGEMNGEVDKALDKQEKALLGIMKEADKCRLNTLKELFDIY